VKEEGNKSNVDEDMTEEHELNRDKKSGMIWRDAIPMSRTWARNFAEETKRLLHEVQ
jgi:hypothetical protein